MQKITIRLLLLLMVSFSSYSQIQIGTGTSTLVPNSVYPLKAPFYPAAGYSYCQSIYLNSEINASGAITTISWQFSGSGTLEKSQNLVVYMGHTSKTHFDTTKDFIPVAELNQVYNGTISTNAEPGWIKITLNTPFTYDSSYNLVIAVDENTPGLEDSVDEVFFNTEVSEVRSITNWRTSSDVLPSNPGTAASVTGFNSFVPNIILGGIHQGCETPNFVTAQNLTANSATISWQAPSSAPSGGSDYYYNTSGVPPTETTTRSGHIDSGNSFNLSQLSIATEYYVWVRSNCGSGSLSSWSTPYLFRTNCETKDNLIEYFDDVTVPDLPFCWRKVLRGAGLSQYAAVVTKTTGTQHTAPNTVQLSYVDSAVPAEVFLISPALSNIAAATHHVTFYARGNNTKVLIGTMTTNDDSGVFTEVGSFSPNGTMFKYEYDFKNYHGSNQYIAFKLDGNQIYDPQLPPFVALDSFIWEPISGCADAKNLKVASTTPITANVTWDPVGATQYQLAYGEPTVTDPNQAKLLDPTTSFSQIITGLKEATTYKMWLRAICGTKTGNWQEPVTFTTTCTAVSTFMEEFNDSTTPTLPTCWSKIIRGTTVGFSTIETRNDALDTANKNVLMHSRTSSTSDDIILVSPNLNTLKQGTYRLKFYAKSGSNLVSLKVGTLNSNTDTALFTFVQDVTLTEEMKEYVVEFNTYSGNNTYIGIKMDNSTNISKFGYITLDNILWEFSPPCYDVTEIKVPEINPESVKMTWIKGGSETTWNIALGNPTVKDPNTLTPFIEVKGTPSKVVGGLTVNTTYKAWVRSVCTEDGNGAWIGPVYFTTVCSPSSSLNENFEGITSPNLPVCWSKILTGTETTNTNPPSIKSKNNVMMPDATTAIEMYSADANSNANIILVSPPINNIKTGKYRLRFKAKGNGTLQVGTLDTNLSTATFYKVNELTTSFNPKEYTVDITSYGAIANYIGIRLVGNVNFTYDQIDNVIWEEIPPCPDVVELKVDYTTVNTANIYWNANTASKWEYVFANENATNPDDFVPRMLETPVKLLDQLASGTTYKIWVRSSCNNGADSGNWSTPLVFKTQCSATTVTYVMDFETASAPALPECTSSRNIALSPANWYVGNNPGFGFNSKTLIYNSDLNVDANAWFFTSGISLTGGVTYNLSFRYGGSSNDLEFYDNDLKVMYGTAASSPGMINQIANYTHFALDAPVSKTLTVTPLTTGVYYFGFNVYSGHNSRFMFIDDIKVEEQHLSAKQFELSHLNFYPNPVKDILTISNENEISDVTVYNLLGQEVLSKRTDDTTAQIDMSSLASGSYLVKVSSNNLVKHIKVIKQ